MGKRFSCDALRVKNTISCSAETGLASPDGATTAAETLTLTEDQLGSKLMFTYRLREPSTSVVSQTLTINLPFGNFLPIINVFATATSQDASETTAERVSIRRVSGTQYVLSRANIDNSYIEADDVVQIVGFTYEYSGSN